MCGDTVAENVGKPYLQTVLCKEIQVMIEGVYNSMDMIPTCVQVSHSLWYNHILICLWHFMLSRNWWIKLYLTRRLHLNSENGYKATVANDWYNRIGYDLAWSSTSRSGPLHLMVRFVIMFSSFCSTIKTLTHLYTSSLYSQWLTCISLLTSLAVYYSVSQAPCSLIRNSLWITR